MTRFVCVHGHFYQPPRENPWLEEVERQPGAAPYHDWNERITAECYRANASARILDGRKRILHIVNNYARMSFDFGPTLLGWMERAAPAVYRAVLDADRESRERFSGHGGAMAQGYNHVILPLASRRDKRTQVAWGLRDFERRFGRPSEGLWLPETAVDVETLEALAGAGVRFTVLAPHQAARVRAAGERAWRPAGEAPDLRRPWLCRLPSGRSIAIFLYDGAISHEIAFGPLLHDGGLFARRLLAGFGGEDRGPRLVHVATDGETYGHHHRFGDMALGFALRRIESSGEARLTTYGEFLDLRPPRDEVEIAENTSWSCVHGLERWRSDCGCRTGPPTPGGQAWRAPLREALDGLRDRLDELFERLLSPLVRDPWAARDGYIDVVLDRSEASVRGFFERHAARAPAPEPLSRALALLEMQRFAMLMFTSCAWFFDEISGLEGVQALRAAARAMQLAREAGGPDLEPEFVRRMERAPAAAPYGNGARLYDEAVRPARIDPPRLAAHYAMSSLFEETPPVVRIGAYEAADERREVLDGAGARLASGRVRLSSDVLRRELRYDYAALHAGGGRLTAGTRPSEGDAPLLEVGRELRRAFETGDAGAVRETIAARFGGPEYSLQSLLADERDRVLRRILGPALGAIESGARRIVRGEGSVLDAWKATGAPLPPAVAAPLEFVLNRDLEALLDADSPFDSAAARTLAGEIRRWPLRFEREALSLAAGRRLRRILEGAAADPDDPAPLERAAELLRTWFAIPLDADIWSSQGLFYALARSRWGRAAASASRGDERAARWAAAAIETGRLLGVRVDPDAPEEDARG